MKQLLMVIPLLFLFGCTPKKTENKVTILEKNILDTALQAKCGNQTGPITLSHRKLPLSEISEHLEMDEEFAILHMKSSNIHGYFNLIAKNYPPGYEFVLYQVDMSGQVFPNKTFLVGGNGRLVTELDNLFIDLDNNFLTFANYLPGEPVDFVLRSKDGKYSAGTRIIPNPIEASDSKKHRISVQIDGKDKRHYLVHCRGCQPFGTYMLITQFENERFVHAAQANDQGEIFQPTGPTVPWVTGGDGRVEIRGEDFDSPLTVTFTWGD